MRPDCGGCNDLGAHTRWCPERVGPTAARLGAASERADSLGDFIGGADPHLANEAYRLSMRLWSAAVLAAEAGTRSAR